VDVANRPDLVIKLMRNVKHCAILILFLP